VEPAARPPEARNRSSGPPDPPIAHYYDRPVPTELDAAALARAVSTFRDALRSHQEELNLLNVYPVPDGDTGTNMTLTLESVVAELASAETMPEVCKAIAHGSLMGARGNSGVILSQILRGFGETCRGLAAVDAEALVASLRRAADAAYEAVLRPVEGTILTVARETAEAAEAARDEGADLVAILDRALTAADASVARTPELLPALAQAGVVDAGGRGFTLLIHALLFVVDARALPEPHIVDAPAIVTAYAHGDDAASLRYEVMFFLEGDDDAIPAFKATWASLGDSIVVVGGDRIWNCHVHTNDIGAAIEAGIEAGRPSKVRVTDLDEQVEEEAWVREHVTEAGAAEEPVTTAVVAVAVGEGLGRLLRSMGVHEVVAGGQSMNPSTAQILEAVERCSSHSVVVLPNNKNIVPVAEQVDALTDKLVEVVPTTSVVEALSALVGFDPDAVIESNLGAMSEAARRVRAGEVTQAVRDAMAGCGPVKEGDWIAINREGICATAADAATAVVALVDDLVDETGELVTVVTGSEARVADTARLEEHLALAHPHVEVEVHDGGQPLYPYLIGVE
jgi:DAK2 domain fusion protein YloV